MSISFSFTHIQKTTVSKEILRKSKVECLKFLKMETYKSNIRSTLRKIEMDNKKFNFFSKIVPGIAF